MIKMIYKLQCRDEKCAKEFEEECFSGQPLPHCPKCGENVKFVKHEGTKKDLEDIFDDAIDEQSEDEI